MLHNAGSENCLMGGQQDLLSDQGAPNGMGRPGGPGSRNTNITYKGATELKTGSTEDSHTYQSSKTDENALLISTKEAVALSQPTISKTGSSDGGDNCSFYGVNAAMLVKGGSVTTIKGGKITSNATGANGVFSYGGNGGRNGGQGDGTTVIIEDTEIITTGDGSGGIMTTGGGVTKAKNLSVCTSGRSSAPIRTDRGGGIVTVEGGSYTSNGLGSPVIYSTADVTVSDATLTSNKSEGVCIEGKNSITLNNCQMTVSNTQRNGHAQFLDAIMIYQSFSGDADSGNSHFTMNGGSLTNKQGHLFHVTNTNAIITLNGVTLKNEDAANVLLSVCADGQHNIINLVCLFKQRRYLIISESGYAAANASHEECQFGMLLGKPDEFIHIRSDSFHTALHGGDCIALALQSYALSHDGSELAVGDVSRTASMHTSQIAAEYKDLVRLQRCNKLWCCSFLFHNLFSDKVHIFARALVHTILIFLAKLQKKSHFNLIFSEKRLQII